MIKISSLDLHFVEKTQNSFSESEKRRLRTVKRRKVYAIRPLKQTKACWHDDLFIIHRQAYYLVIAHTDTSVRNINNRKRFHKSTSKAMISQFLLLLQLQSILWVTALPSSSLEDVPIALPGCKDHCGDVKIPYPFGIGANCSPDAEYEIICNTSSHPPKPFLHKFNLEVIDISRAASDQMLKVRIPAISMCGSEGADGVSTTTPVKSVDFGGSPYRFSKTSNVLMVENCGGSVVLKNRSGAILTGCASYCDNSIAVANMNITSCYGIGCCQASVSRYIDRLEGLDFYEIAVDHITSTSSSTCTLTAALIDRDYELNNSAGRLSHFLSFPTVLEWSATYLPAIYYTRDYANFSCFNGIVNFCFCNFPYEGNPYLPDGCQVVRECQKCSRHCAFNDTGSYYYCEKKPFLKRPSVLGFGIAMGLVLLVLGCYLLYRLVKRRMEIKRRAKFFKRNGGLLLQQQISSGDGVVEKTKVFSITELENATDNFNENRILGQGGQGTVYKGMLMDGRIVAVKKSKKVDESQLEQFINEMVILSQINHRNVVKLLGCCLETEVPLLVYEFIPNGTLYQHIHDPNEDFHVTWKMRLQIAEESAGALAYLHSSSSAPIYHRDIKSSNILLDDKYRAKVSDFGTSRAITIEQTHVTTCVQGTYGYLDPEYFQSNQFTDKSDVYSFGVVLVELITGKKPICPTESGGWISLATEFLSRMENCALFDILDTRVSEEGKEEEFIVVADLARQCLNMNGKQRPTMKEVVMLLEEIRSAYVPNSKEPNCVKSRCEVMEISHIHG